MTCIIIGGGYAGIHAAHSILKQAENLPGVRLRLVLIDKQPYHLRKVLLFRPAAGEAEITIPLAHLFPEGVELIQGTATAIDSPRKLLHYADAEGSERQLPYDTLVVAVGSVVRKPDEALGGLALTDVQAAAAINLRWRDNLRLAAKEADPAERQRLLTVAVAGAGISGLETAAELAHAMGGEARAHGLAPDEPRVVLLNAQDRLFPEGPVKVGRKLERALRAGRVEVKHGVKALREHSGVLALSDGASLPVGLCVWTLGLTPHPSLRTLGLPLTAEGQVEVDASYRVQGASGVYSIGDCARIIDPDTGRADAKTCKEGSAQAARLSKVIAADLQGLPAPAHQGFMDFYCFGLGPERGMVWTRLWGLDIIMTGKLGWKLRKYTWDIASMVR